MFSGFKHDESKGNEFELTLNQYRKILVNVELNLKTEKCQGQFTFTIIELKNSRRHISFFDTKN
jgi:hypothetical protein